MAGRIEIARRGTVDGNLARAEGPIRAGLYVRVSTQAQAERWSLPAQRRILNDLAERREWDAILYDEGGASAETIDARPQMQRLLADVNAGQIDLVAVVEMERLCRASDLRDWATITTTLRDADVQIVTPERQYNLGTAEDDFEADLRGILSKREKRKLLERTRRGLNEAKDAGRFAGGSAPTGYRYDPASKKIVPDPEKVPLVERIFASDLSPWHLSRQLAAEGTHLPYPTIKRIRTNPAYLGLRPNTAGELITADWPAIIDRKLWDRQQARQQRATRRSPRKGGHRYFLSGIIRCHNCGKAVVGSPIPPSKKTGMPLFVYKCLNPRKCPGHGGQLSGWLVDLLVLKALREYAGDPEILKERYARAIEDAGRGDATSRRADLLDRRADLEARQTRLLDAVEQGLLPDAVIRKRQKAIAAELKLVNGELTTVVDSELIPSLPNLRAILELAGHLSAEDRAAHRELLERLAVAVEVDPPSRALVVRWRLGGEFSMPVPRLRGGPGRSVEWFMHHLAVSA